MLPSHRPTFIPFKKWSAALLGLAAGCFMVGGVPQATALCPAPERYDELNAYIDEIWSTERYACLDVEADPVTDAATGRIWIVTDIINGCEEGILVEFEDPPYQNNEFISSGEAVTLEVQVESYQNAPQGEGELEFRVDGEDEPIVRVLYSFEGTPRDNRDVECNDEVSVGCGGCAASSSTPAHAPLTWVMVGLGLVGLGRRVRRSARS
ncbi:hypothetical protein EA187_01820 [Lujinxingia sediminis]|uniref:PEP-CTERM sorting domain-containing protein n=1 Tax=Lujinxingia sediminis TaxID=2480984 RepID=A0ABY0CXP0_9DELT|nr:MYXO-CTERM sorting domain-containing protein [Lujinxingia sediminis]RVU48200.1 hypothetical protein EA187_01820 [Lujinxingia sediminis]